MTRVRSWRSVAIELGHRMQHHAHRDGCGHRDGEAVEGCPFCDDWAAYQAFTARLDAERAPDRLTQGRLS